MNRQRGSYNTRQKAQILEYIEAHPRMRLTVDELARTLEVGKTTVYRLLEAMSESGQVRKYQDADGATCYQYVRDTDACSRHSHLICTDCGELLHVDCELLQQLIDHVLDEHGFALNTEKMLLYGRCANCEKKEM